jgi:hypothetical protein
VIVKILDLVPRVVKVSGTGVFAPVTLCLYHWKASSSDSDE